MLPQRQNHWEVGGYEQEQDAQTHPGQLEERELLFTELVEITSRAQKHSGNLLYTLGPTQENRYTL